MGYKLLGFVVWQAARMLVRWRFPNLGRKLAIAGLAGTLAVGAVVAARAARSSGE